MGSAKKPYKVMTPVADPGGGVRWVRTNPPWLWLKTDRY